MTWWISGIALVIVAVTGFRGVRPPPPTCDTLAEAQTLVPFEVRPDDGDVPLVGPEDLAVAACLRVRVPEDGQQEPEVLAQVLVCSRVADELEVPFATSTMVGSLSLVDGDGETVEALPPPDGLEVGSFVAALPTGTCLLFEDVLDLDAGLSERELFLEAVVGVAFDLRDDPDASPSIARSPEALDDLPTGT